MFSSRRMKTNKVFKDGSQIFIKSSILKNFCSEVIRTATVLFIDTVPEKGFCERAVGKCVVFCLVILLQLAMEHFITHKRLLLSLICTQKPLKSGIDQI